MFKCTTSNLRHTDVLALTAFLDQVIYVLGRNVADFRFTS